MKLSLLPFLACSDCGGDIRFSSLDGDPRVEPELETGTLACGDCRRRFPIEESIPRFFPKEGLARANRRTRKSFGWEWERYPGSMEEDLSILLEETQIKSSDWQGLACLDAGCGMGRYTKAALGLGSQMIAFDLSDAITRLVPLAREQERLHLVQGDLFHPPFKPGVFDIVYSQGVLHHTPDTRTAFRKVAPLVKEGGKLSVWVYGTPGSYRSFASNPLREGRRRLEPLRPLLWLVVWTRLILSDMVRAFTTRLPVPVLYAFCFPLAVLGAIPFVKYLTFSVHPNFRVRLIENFDWLAPPYQHKHTKEEVRGWFYQEGFLILRQLSHGVVPKVGFLGIRQSIVDLAAGKR